MQKPRLRDGRQTQLSIGTAPLISTPILVLDEENETIVAIQMLGVSQSVNANWAALMGGGKSDYIHGVYVKLGGTKKHVKLQKLLPETGWKELWLIHKQASANEMDAGEPFFYLLQQQEEDVPANFIGLLDKAIPIPVREQWAAYLFTEGLRTELIRPLDEYHCVGWVGYKVTCKGWDAIISEGIASRHITF